MSNLAVFRKMPQVAAQNHENVVYTETKPPFTVLTIFYCSDTVRCHTTKYQYLWTYLIHLGSQKNSKTYILRKIRPLSAESFTGDIVYLYGLQ